MSEEKKIPKGGKKGGTRFPQISLEQAVGFAKKLVAKTHTGAQPAKIILKGVFNNTGPLGGVRASALKQYGLLDGEASAYTATTLAKNINSAPDEELPPLLITACLAPKLFKDLFDTFQSDSISVAKLRQQALQLGVHPDNGDKAVQMFVESTEFAGLAVRSGEDIRLSTASEPADEGEEVPPPADDESPKQDENEPGEDNKGNTRVVSPAGRGQMNISLSLDSTMDPEKLEKYLKLLRDYGAIG
ncbi:hypothetical protein BH20VER1_BH20VER1_05480 [soil metagenome]